MQQNFLKERDERLRVGCLLLGMVKPPLKTEGVIEPLEG